MSKDSRHILLRTVKRVRKDSPASVLGQYLTKDSYAGQLKVRKDSPAYALIQYLTKDSYV